MYVKVLCFVNYIQRELYCYCEPPNPGERLVPRVERVTHAAELREASFLQPSAQLLLQLPSPTGAGSLVRRTEKEGREHLKWMHLRGCRGVGGSPRGN